MKIKIWHKWVDWSFPEETVSLDIAMERLVQYVEENNKSFMNVPPKSSLVVYLMKSGKYIQIKEKNRNSLWRKASEKEMAVKEQMGLSKLERLA